ncbi:MAG: EF-hand domain-containing protein [Sedimenticolaceae bacterium]
MLKPPVGFRGDTGIGALTGLSGVGQQDQFLYEKIPREPKYPEYTHATPYYRFYRPTSTSFLGEEIRHVFRPQNMGDLLTSLMIKCRFPPTSGSVTCLRNLGLSMIKKADLLIDGLVVQTFQGEWMSIYESMYSSEQDREDIFNTIFNLGGAYDTGVSLKTNDTTQTLFFPLPFFFNKHYVDSKVDTTSFRVPFPLCSIHNSEVTLVMQFYSLAEIVSDTSGFAAGADLLDFKFVTREVTLTPQERFMLVSKPQEYPIEKINREEIEVPATVGAKFRYYFNSAYSCRSIFWTFKNKLSGYNPIFYTPIITAQVVTLNKTDRGEVRKPLFFQEFQAYVHNFHNNKTFYAYSFAEQPLQVVLGDYEFRAPRPQSAYIDMFFTTVSAGYELWSGQFASTQQNYTVQDTRIILDTSVGLGGSSVLKSLRMNSYGYFRTNTARVGIPGTSYSSTSNDGPPPIPYKMRFEPWVQATPEGYIKITSDARTNINTFIPAVETFLVNIYYLSTSKFVAVDGRGTVVDRDGSNGVVEGKFNRIDTDGSGFIDAIEFDVSTYDRDRDGKVSFAEFKEIEEG